LDFLPFAYNLIRTLRPSWGCGRKAALFVDGGYIGEATEDALGIPSANIETIRCLERPQAYAQYGTKAVGGAILITTG
jgi:hypothetical protein